VYLDNEQLPNLINRLTISNEIAYIPDEALCDCFLSPKLSHRAYVASMQKAGLNRRQMAKALDAYDKYDRDEFLDVISELSPSALTQQYEVITTGPYNFADRLIDEIDVRQFFRSLGHIYVDNESSPKDDDDKTFIKSLSAFFAQKLSPFDDIDDDAFDEKIAELICGYSIVFMEWILNILTDELGILDPVVETLVGIVQRDIVRQCRGRYCNEGLYDSLREHLSEFVATLPEHMQPKLSATVDKDSAEEEIEEDEPQNRFEYGRTRLKFPTALDFSTDNDKRKSFLLELFDHFGSELRDITKEQFLYLFGYVRAEKPSNYPEQFVWIGNRNEFALIMGTLYKKDYHKHINKLILYVEDAEKGEKITKWSENRNKLKEETSGHVVQDVLNIVKRYGGSYKGDVISWL
jgi:hypothetical protein